MRARRPFLYLVSQSEPPPQRPRWKRAALIAGTALAAACIGAAALAQTPDHTAPAPQAVAAIAQAAPNSVSFGS